MTALTEQIVLHSGAGFANLSLAQELRRQPWLTDEERIAFAVEAATEFMFTEDQLAEHEEESFEKGKDEGRSEMRDESEALAKLLREVVNGDIDPEDFADWQERVARALKEYDR